MTQFHHHDVVRKYRKRFKQYATLSVPVRKDLVGMWECCRGLFTRAGLRACAAPAPVARARPHGDGAGQVPGPRPDGARGRRVAAEGLVGLRGPGCRV